MYAKEKAKNYVNSYTAGGAAAAGIIPVPGVTSVALTAAEATMIAQIAQIYGLRTDAIIWPVLLKLILVKAGGSAGLKALAEGLNVVPVIGWLAKPFVAGAAVKVIGEGAIAFFESRFPGQRVNEKPNWEAFLAAFPVGDVDMQQLKDYWNSL